MIILPIEPITVSYIGVDTLSIDAVGGVTLQEFPDGNGGSVQLPAQQIVYTLSRPNGTIKNVEHANTYVPYDFYSQYIVKIIIGTATEEDYFVITNFLQNINPDIVLKFPEPEIEPEPEE